MSVHKSEKQYCLHKTLHSLPKDQSIRNAWLKFIFNDMPEQLKDKAFVCSSHLTTDSLVNYSKYAVGVVLNPEKTLQTL